MNSEAFAQKYTSTAGFAARFYGFFEAAGPAGIAVVVLGLLLLLALGLFGRRRELMFLLIMAATFSGAMWSAVDSGSTVIRWVILVILALNVFRLRVYPGTPLVLLLSYVFLGIGFITFSEELAWSIQTGGLLLLTVLTGVALADTMHVRADVRRVLYIFLASASAWFVIAVITLPQLMAAKGGGRFSGAITSAPLFVNTGGVLLIISVWATLCSRKNWLRFACGCLAMALVVLLFVSGQRTGTLAGLIGCTPLLFRKKVSNLVLMVALMGVVALAGVRLATANKSQVEFLKKRYLSTSTTGRTKIWKDAITEIIKSPIIGRGHGSDRSFAVKYHRPTHNVFLAVWYNTGIVGLLLYVSAYAAAAIQCLRLIRGGRDQEIRDLARVTLGMCMALGAMGMTETLASPSNFATITHAILFAMIGRLWIISHEEARQAATAQATQLRYVWVPALPVRPSRPGVQPGYAR